MLLHVGPQFGRIALDRDLGHVRLQRLHAEGPERRDEVSEWGQPPGVGRARVGRCRRAGVLGRVIPIVGKEVRELPELILINDRGPELDLRTLPVNGRARWV